MAVWWSSMASGRAPGSPGARRQPVGDGRGAGAADHQMRRASRCGGRGKKATVGHDTGLRRRRLAHPSRSSGRHCCTMRPGARARLRQRAASAPGMTWAEEAGALPAAENQQVDHAIRAGGAVALVAQRATRSRTGLPMTTGGPARADEAPSAQTTWRAFDTRRPAQPVRPAQHGVLLVHHRRRAAQPRQRSWSAPRHSRRSRRPRRVRCGRAARQASSRPRPSDSSARSRRAASPTGWPNG